MLGLCDRNIGLMGPMQGLIFFVSIPPVIFIFEFALELDDTEGVVRFIGHKIALNIVLQPLITAGVERLCNHLDICKVAYFEFRFHQINAIDNGFHLIQKGWDVFVLQIVNKPSDAIPPDTIPPDAIPITNKWVSMKKTDLMEEIVKHKARLVIKGCSQHPGFDFNETFFFFFFFF